MARSLGSVFEPFEPIGGRPGFWRRLGRGLGRLFGKRYYDGGKPTSRFREFGSKAAGPNAITEAMGRSLRDRCRDMVRNDPHCARVVAIHVNNIVGSGIVSTAAVPDEQDVAAVARAKRANEIWKARGARGACDVEGQHTRDALMQVAVRGMVESGGALIRRVFDRSAPLIPYRYEVLEIDLLDDLKNGQLESGNRVVQGVEFNAKGRRVAYWILPEHPGEGSRYGVVPQRASVRVPEQDIIHLFVPLRPKQVREIPWLAPVLALKRDLADYESYELLRKKTEAAVVAFVIPGEGMEGDVDTEDKDGIAPSVVDADGRLVEDMQPGLIARLRRGKEVRFNTPIIPGGYPEYMRSRFQSFAVGAGVSYEQATGDLSQANYSSLRAGLLEFWRGTEMTQWLHVIPSLCDRWWQWEMEGAFLAGLLDMPSVPVEHSAPRKQSVDPSKDVLADVLDVRALFVPWEDKVAERGYEADAHIERIRRTNAKLDAALLVSDADPRKMAFRGAFAQALAGTAASETVNGAEATDEERRFRALLVKVLGLGAPLTDGRTDAANHEA